MIGHLGLDIGGTASRWVLCDDDGMALSRGKAPGATAHLFNPAEREKLARALEAVAEDLGPATVASVSAGVTGFGAAVLPEAKALLAQIFSTDRIVVVDDVALAYMANFAPGEGHLIAAGTGSIGTHIAADGRLVRVGGRGILIDDAGSGSWIALRALDRLYRTLDSDGSFDAVSGLAEALFEQIGGSSWSDVKRFVYAGDRGSIGALSLAVARAAEEGDRVALQILREAGDELAILAGALIERVGLRPIGLSGGVLGLHPVILEQIKLRQADAKVTVLAGDAALFAARLQRSNPKGWAEIAQRLTDAAS